MGQPIVGDESDEEWSDELDTIAHRIRAVRGRERNPEPDRRMAREETHRKMQARKAEDKTVFDGLRRRYKRQAAENEADLMARVWETERAQVVRLSTRWVENVANVCAPSGAQRNRQLQSSNAAVADLRERRRTLRSLQGALRRAARLPAGRAGRLPDIRKHTIATGGKGALTPPAPAATPMWWMWTGRTRWRGLWIRSTCSRRRTWESASSKRDSRCMPCRSPSGRRWPRSRSAPTWR